MTTLRPLLWLVAGLTVGGATGLAAGLQWAPELSARWHRVWRPRRPYVQRSRDPEQWRQDSAHLAAAQARAAVARGPREVRRVQALNTCAISMEIRDTLWQHLQLFHVGAWDSEQPGVVVAEAWAYHDRGFALGDTVTAVLPNVYCGDLRLATFGASLILPTPPVQMNVR